MTNGIQLTTLRLLLRAVIASPLLLFSLACGGEDNTLTVYS